MQELIAEMQGCEICAGLPLGPQPIFKIDPAAKILIAGQAPGRITLAKGVPFDDPSGDRLRRWMGIDRVTFYDDPRLAILPMGLCFPGSGKGGDLPPRAECAPQWRVRTMALMPNLVLTMIIGRYAIDWHRPDLARQTITSAVRNGVTNQQIILPHPSPRNNRWLAKNPWFEEEILPKLKSQVAELL